MAVFSFQKPDKVIMINSTDFEGKFEFRPLEPGYGLTVGNALRRVLLSSLEGFAIPSVRIESVDHEFSTVAGVVEDVTEIILNLKQVRFKRQIDEIDNETVTVSVSGGQQLTAGDFQKFISGFQVVGLSIPSQRIWESGSERLTKDSQPYHSPSNRDAIVRHFFN